VTVPHRASLISSLVLNQSDDSITIDYLLVLYLDLGQHRVVALVLVRQTQVTDALLVGAAVHLQQLVVAAADRLLELSGGRHQLVLLERSGLVVGLQVDLAVGGQTHQTRLHRFVFPPGAHVALHVVSLGETRVDSRRRRCRRGLLESGLFEFLHHVGQHGVPGEHRPRVEVVPALRADEDPEVVVLVPVVLDTVRAVAVAAGDGHGVPQYVQTHRAVELVPVQDQSALSHREKTLKSV